MQQTAYDLLYGRMTEGAASKKQGNKTGSRNMNCSREAEECFRKKKKKNLSLWLRQQSKSHKRWVQVLILTDFFRGMGQVILSSSVFTH